MSIFSLFILCFFQKCLTLITQMKGTLKDSPHYVNYISMYSNADSVGYRKAQIDYNLELTGLSTVPIFIIIGEKETLESGFYCTMNDMLKSEWDSNIELKEIHSDGPPTRVKGTYFVNQTGLYSLVVFSCNSRSSNNTIYTGQVDYINPKGYLPAHKQPYVLIYALIACVMMGLGYYWYRAINKYRKNVFLYHYCISAILLLTLVEMLLNFIYYSMLNLNGNEFPYLYGATRVFLVARKILCRYILFLVSRGVGVMTTTISKKEKTASITIAVVYFFFSSFVEMEVAKNSVFDKNLELLIILSVCDAIFELIFYLAIFHFFLKTLSGLGEEDTFKRHVYRNLCLVAFIGFCAATIFYIFLMAFMGKKLYLKTYWWKYFWFFDFGFSMLVYIYFMMTAMMILTPATEISKYKQLGGDEGDDKNDLEAAKNANEEPLEEKCINGNGKEDYFRIEDTNSHSENDDGNNDEKISEKKETNGE